MTPVERAELAAIEAKMDQFRREGKDDFTALSAKLDQFRRDVRTDFEGMTIQMTAMRIEFAEWRGTVRFLRAAVAFIGFGGLVYLLTVAGNLV